MTIADQIIKHSHSRVFTQDGGARPNIPARLSGVDNQYLVIGGLTMPVRGSVDRIRVHDPLGTGYKTVGASESAADFPTFSMMVREKHGSLPKILTGQDCPFNVYINTGKCTNLSDFAGGWSDYVMVLSQCVISNVDGGDRQSWDADDPVEDSADCTAEGGIYLVGALSFADSGGALTDVEILDVTYADKQTCGNCGPANDGTEWRYALGATGTNPAGVFYSTDGGNTWVALPITGIGASEQPTAIRVINGYLVVFSKIGGGATLSSYYISAINQKTGVPSSTWSEITTGFVATKTINDVYVANSREVYMVADGGYVYTTDNIASGVTVLNAGSATIQNLARVRGDMDGNIVAVGASGTVIKSVNRGSTWAVTAAAPVVASLTAVAVLDADRYWAGSAAGNVYYTLDGGASWTAKGFPNSGAGAVGDLVFATDEVGYILHTVGGVGYVVSTWDGGGNWTASANRILNTVAAVARVNRLAYPRVSNLTTRANNIMVGALMATPDGAVLVGAPNIL